MIFIHNKDKNIKCIHGPPDIFYNKDELAVVCLVKNAEYYINSFISHYFDLGVKHIFFLDNGSTDNTIEFIKQYDNVTIFSSSLSFKKYKLKMKRFLVNNMPEGRWVLCADIDEFFDFPYSDKISLAGFLEYLNQDNYNAVALQMLDMFSDKSLSHVSIIPGEDLRNSFPFYDISAIRKRAYHGNIMRHCDGVHSQVFGINKINLTKTCLILRDGKIKPFINSHEMRNEKPADVSGVLYHYKFIHHFEKKAAEAVKEKNYYKNSSHYRKYFDVARKNRDMIIKLPTAKRLRSTNDLIDAGFIVVSEKYLNHLML